MKLTINGEIRDNIQAQTVQELLEELKLSSVKVAVEVNLNIVKRAEFGIFRLNEGDVIEIVNFVGGG